MAKLVVFSSLIVFFMSCSGQRNSTGYSLINDMMYAETYEAFSDNPYFDNGQTMQAPPEGTIARGKMPHPMDTDGNPLVLENPYEMNEYHWQRGKALYEKTCSACHGVTGKGDGLVVTKGGFPAPPKFSERRWRKIDKYPSGYVYNVITFGYGNMPSHAQQLYSEDRWYVSEYVREKLLRKPKKKKRN